MADRRLVVIATAFVVVTVACVVAVIAGLRSGYIGVELVQMRDPNQPVVEEYTLPDGRTVILPKQGANASSMDALIHGRLVEEGNCLRIETLDAESYLVIWRPYHRLVYRGERATVLTLRDRELARTGDLIGMGGGGGDELHMDIDLGECPGPYWFAGEDGEPDTTLVEVYSRPEAEPPYYALQRGPGTLAWDFDDIQTLTGIITIVEECPRLQTPGGEGYTIVGLPGMNAPYPETLTGAVLREGERFEALRDTLDIACPDGPYLLVTEPPAPRD